MAKLRAFLTGLLRRGRLEREMSEEMQFHIEARVRHLIQRGLSPHDAHRQARMEFGSVERYKEEVRGARGYSLIDELRADLLSGVRTVRRAPGFTTAAALSLALGIGANTLVFGLLDATLLRPLDLPQPERLVTVWNVPDITRPDQLGTSSIARFFAMRDLAQSFESVAAHNGLACGLKTLGVDDGSTPPERIVGQTVSPAMFRTLGVVPMMGRTFTDEEDLADQVAPVIVLTHGMWQRRFGGDPAILGRAITIDRVATTVIGVMPVGFDLFGPQVEFFLPLCLTRAQVESRVGANTVIARLKPGISIAQAQADVNAISARLAASDPVRHKGQGTRVEPYQRSRARLAGVAGQPADDYASSLLILQGAVVLVLLIACANVAGLLLARSASRRTEVAVRMALGAGRWRVVRQFVTENLPLALLGAIGGVLLARGGLAVFVATAPPDFPRLDHLAIDLRVLAFTAATVLLTTAVFAIAPALQASNVPFVSAVKESSRSATADARRQGARRLLVTAQVALALVLLVGAGLLIHSFVRAVRNELGANPRNLLTFDFRFPQRGAYTLVGTYRNVSLYEVDPRPAETAERVLERLETQPGIVAVAAINRPPFSGSTLLVPFTIDGRPEATQPLAGADASARPMVDYIAITRSYFGVMGIPIRRGRDFSARDDGRAPFVVIINETMARRFFPNQDPVGTYMKLDSLPDEPSRQIVGVVGDTRTGPFQSVHEPAVYVPHLQQTSRFGGPAVYSRIGMNFVVRTVGEPMAMVPSIKRAVAEIDRVTPVATPMTVEQTLDVQVRHLRLYMLLLTVFGVVSAILAATGIYGVMAHAVAERTREIGIRMALGASLGDVLAMVLGHASLVVGAGLLLGLAASLALGRLIASSLFEVTPTDPVTYAAVSVLLLLVAGLACLIPGRRAATVNPTVALKYE
jgi:putative ABC transport system permease protein